MGLINLIPPVDISNVISKFWTIIKFGSLIIPLSLIVLSILKLIGTIKMFNLYNNYIKKIDEVDTPKYEKEMNRYYEAIKYFRKGK